MNYFATERRKSASAENQYIKLKGVFFLIGKNNYMAISRKKEIFKKLFGNIL